MKAFAKNVLTLALAAISPLATAAPVELDRVLTVVNEGVILSSDVETLKRNVKLNASGRQLPPDSQLEQQILDQLILEKIQLQEAEKLGIRIDDTRLRQAIEQIANEKGLSIQALHDELKLAGISWETYREQIRKEVVISEIRKAQVRRRINVLPQEIDALTKQLYAKDQQETQYALSQIQIRLEEDASKSEREAALKKAQAILGELRQGKDFASLAIAKSNGPRALNGGHWGWMRIEEMPTIFADQIKEHQKGDIIGPFRSGVGYHLLKIDDMKGLQTVSVTEVNARHILIKPTIVLSDKAIEKQLTDIKNKIARNELTFADAAKQLSADTGSAAKGGELGWQISDLYVPEFKQRVDTMPTHQISAPFKTDHGWHIVEVLDRRKADRTDEAMKNRAYQLIMNRKFNEETQAWLQELRAAAYIENIKENDGSF